jgi:hypothetical protein
MIKMYEDLYKENLRRFYVNVRKCTRDVRRSTVDSTYIVRTMNDFTPHRLILYVQNVQLNIHKSSLFRVESERIHNVFSLFFRLGVLEGRPKMTQ